MTWDSRVSEETAAALLVVALGTIRNRASSDPVLPFVKVGNRRTYRLVDIAAVLDSR